MIIEIISGLYIGNFEDAYDKNIYKQYGIDIVLNCSSNQPFVDVDNVQKVRLPLVNMESLKNNKQKILQFIESNYMKQSMLLLSNEDYPLVICCLFLTNLGNVSVVDIKQILAMKHSSLRLERNLDEF
tara:strand:+ start:183 stop:566 length:384 start_codon:yes stop_codon:yes gene_type:complete